MNIFWDLENHKLVAGLTNQQEVTALTWYARDTVPVTLALVRPNSSDDGYTAEEAPAGYAVKFAVKASSGMSGDPLVLAATWTQSGSGSTARYSANVSLNTTELIAALGSATELAVIAEFTLADGGGVNRDSTQVDLTVKPDVFRSGQTDPETLALQKPWLEEYTDAQNRKCVRVRNSDGQILQVFVPA